MKATNKARIPKLTPIMRNIRLVTSLNSNRTPRQRNYGSTNTRRTQDEHNINKNHKQQTTAQRRADELREQQSRVHIEAGRMNKRCLRKETGLHCLGTSDNNATANQQHSNNRNIHFADIYFTHVSKCKRVARNINYGPMNQITGRKPVSNA